MRGCYDAGGILAELPPIPMHFTRAIAERSLALVADGERRPLILRIGEPVRDVPTVSGNDWRCPVHIDGLDDQKLSPGIGVDSLQALVHALKSAQAYMAFLERETGGTLLWLDHPGHGLPDVTRTR